MIPKNINLQYFIIHVTANNRQVEEDKKIMTLLYHKNSYKYKLWVYIFMLSDYIFKNSLKGKQSKFRY